MLLQDTVAIRCHFGEGLVQGTRHRMMDARCHQKCGGVAMM
jgi:hypothetical protein